MTFDEAKHKLRIISEEELLLLKDDLEDYLKEIAIWYAKEVNVWDFYFDLTNKPEIKKILKSSPLPVNWELNLSENDDNYTQFVECLPEVIFYLSQASNSYYSMLIGWGANKNFLLAGILESKYDA
jgi:hypothetical protein